MYAQCPECLTFFHLKPSHLKAANGRVRCSRCKHAFNALETLRDELSPEEIAAVEDARRREPKSDAPLLNEEYAGDLFDGLDYTETAELALTQPAEAPPEPAPDAVAATMPHDFSPPRAPRRASALLILGNLLLVLVLAAQIIHWQRFEILEHPLAGPPLARAYALLHIALEAPRDLAALKISRTEVSSHPDHPRALHLTAMLENSANRAQPWPELRVDLQDRWGETVAARYFTPREYLREPQEAAHLLRAGERHAVELAIRDPGSAAVGFQVEACFTDDNAQHVCRSDAFAGQ